ncbi:MAG: sigma 54-interacting transcriptional regulator [Flavonifractor plautii]
MAPSPARPGRAASAAFSFASGGSIFLDEVNLLTATMQPKFLRVLQEMEIDPVGGEKSIPIDVRVIAASNIPLETLVEAGQFRDRPLLPPQRHPHPGPRPAGAEGGSAPACGQLYPPAQLPARHGHRGGGPRCHGPADGLRLAGQRPRAAERGGERHERG